MRSSGCARAWASLTPQQEEAIEAMTRGIINKIAHGAHHRAAAQASNPDGVHLSDHSQAVPSGEVT